MRCRILYLVGQLGGGGLERQLYYLFQVLDRERYQPALAVWNPQDIDVYREAIETLGIRVHVFRSGASRTEKLFAFRRLVRQLQPEVVHSYSFHTNFAASWGVLGTRAIAIGSVRSDSIEAKRQTGPLLGRLSARWPRHQIFNSRAAAQSAQQSRGFFAPSGLSVIRNGVDLQTFRYLPLPSETRARILCVGSLRPVKRWDRLLRVIAQLRVRELDFDVQIAGEGPLRAQLQQQIVSLGLSSCVHLLGYCSDIPDLLARSWMLTHTSDSEGCPNVVGEAMACGRPTIATDVGDVNSLVENGVTGFVVSRQDEAAFADRIATVVTSRSICARMGRAARAKAEKELSIERLVTETLNVYRNNGWSDSADVSTAKRGFTCAG